MYCGAGGFSEGFRQAGFSIKWAVDNWEPAVMTFRKNFPGTTVTRGDILDENQVAINDLEKVDVLIGGPPCTHFSLANKGGNGDLKSGLNLVARFLDAVEVIGPRYWIMENVPNLEVILAGHQDEQAFSAKRLGSLLRKTSVFHAEQFGVPQARQRLFAGNFPDPLPIENQPIPMKAVVFGLPNPMADKADVLPRYVDDPLYDSIRLPPTQLTDHFYDTTLSADQVKLAKMWKEHHPWYGRMSFPDSVERPSRTIAATLTKSGRASIVIRDERMGGKYRVPTLRECASLQGFPTTFQFWAPGPSDKQRLIGNSVPPPVARAIAMAIAREEGIVPPSPPDFPVRELPERPPSKPKKSRPFNFPINRHYRFSVKGTLPYCRVELDNKGRHPTYPIGEEAHHVVGWRNVFVLGYAKDYAAFRIDLKTAYAIAEAVSQTTLDGMVEKTWKAALAEFAGEVPDATSLQASWAGKISLDRDPNWILQKVAEIAEKITGGPNRGGNGVEASVLAPLLRGRRFSGGDEIVEHRWRNKTIDAYTASSLLSLSVATKLANEGSQWLARDWERRYVASHNIESVVIPTTVARESDVVLLRSNI